MIGQHQIIGVDNLIPSTITQDIGNCTALGTCDLRDILRAVMGQAAGYFGLTLICERHQIAAFKITLDTGNTGGQEAFSVP